MKHILCTIGFHKTETIAWGIPKMSVDWVNVYQCARCGLTYSTWSKLPSRFKRLHYVRGRKTCFLHTTNQYNLLADDVKIGLTGTTQHIYGKHPPDVR